jgi:hypothetical protein
MNTKIDQQSLILEQVHVHAMSASKTYGSQVLVFQAAGKVIAGLSQPSVLS